MKLPFSALVVLVAYVVAITAFGTWLGRRGQSVRDYFLAARSVPWWAIATCIVATETSTLTFIGAPGTAYSGDWTFLQLVLGYIVGRLLIAALFIPAYFRGEIYTSYELLQRRFGGAVRTVSADHLPPLPHAGRRHPAARRRPGAVGGGGDPGVVVHRGPGRGHDPLHRGGRRGRHHLDGLHPDVRLPGRRDRLPGVRDPAPCPTASAAPWRPPRPRGKLTLFDFSFDPTMPFTFWAGLVGGAFLTLATHGTDHYLVQRLLVARSQKDASAGLVLSGFLVMAQFALFLFLGTLLWAHYGGRPFARGDEVLPTFVSTELPGGWTGFILAAMVAAALSPSLNSMASTTVRDLYLPHFRPGASEAQQLRVGKAFTIVWGIAQILVAVAAQNMDSALQNGLAALSYASGPDRGRVPAGRCSRARQLRGHA